MNTVFSYRLFPNLSRPLLRGILTFLPVALLFLSKVALADNEAPTGMSEAKSLGHVFCNVLDSTNNLGSVFSAVAYIAAIYFGIQGVIHLKNRFENPQQNPLHKAMTYLGAAAALAAIPSFEGMLINTFFDAPAAGGAYACDPNISGTASNVTLDVMMTNMITNIKDPMRLMLSVIAETMGFYLIVRGLMKATKHGTDPKLHSMTNIYTSLIIGAVLCAVGSNLEMVMGSLFGYTQIHANDIKSWAVFTGLSGDMTQFQSAIGAALTFFQLVGLISFIRGWTILRQAVEGQGQHTVSQGLTHILGGVIAINIYGFLPLLNATFGTKFTS